MLEKGFCRKNNYGTPAAYFHISKEKNYESEMTEEFFRAVAYNMWVTNGTHNISRKETMPLSEFDLTILTEWERISINNLNTVWEINPLCINVNQNCRRC